MTNAEWISLFRQIPQEFLGSLVVVTQTGVELSLELIFRLDPSYAVVRGRTAGTTDTGRAFFLPYSQIDFLKIERALTEADLQSIFANAPPVSHPGEVAMPLNPAALAGAKTPAPSTPAVPVDAKQALLAKLRATRSAVMPRPSSSQPPPV